MFSKKKLTNKRKKASEKLPNFSDLHGQTEAKTYKVFTCVKHRVHRKISPSGGLYLKA